MTAVEPIYRGHLNIFHVEAAAALAEGYRCRQPCPRGELLRAVRYTWAIESFWWIKPSLDTFSQAPERFVREMLWTAAQ